jgi:diguanylate cyclase (GGDEF)-like protein
MSVVVIVLEIWMIIRMIRTIFEKNLQSQFWNLTEKYFSNYFLLLSSGVLMLLFAVRALYDKRKHRWLAVLVILMCSAVAVFEIWMLTKYPGSNKKNIDLLNYIILLTASLIMIGFSFVMLSNGSDKKWQSLTVMYVFSFVCINFGIIISANGYAKGEQILSFLTMELFVVCLLTWRPILGFVVLTSSYLVFYHRISGMIDLSTVGKFTGIVDFSTVDTGLGDGIKINGFTMWLSTLLFCISNYNKTLSQAQKDENLEEINSYLSRISVEDELTGIHNMVYFRTEAEKLLNYVTTDKESVIFLFFDIENFKSYNEKYGFHEGNELLINFARHMEESFKGSLVSRYSDDHFVVLTKDEGSMDIIRALSEKTRDLQREVQLTLKCGAYKPVGNESDVSLACDRARFACNSIKKHFDRNYCLYDKSLEERFTLKQYIVNNIDNAIANGYIKVYYQPVVSTDDGCICGLEALARWQDPNYGLLSPGVFIEVLEEYRQIYKLDVCIIEQVCKDYRRTCDNKEPFVPVSLNFSRLDFELCDIVGILDELAEKYKVPKNYLDVEITESALTEQQNFLQKAMSSLHENGYSIWLDDFGSGYSSLNVLKDYQFDVMKIDMKFLSGFSSNNKTRTILKNIVGLTKQLGMTSLTEGVETSEQFEFLRSIECNRVQGYYFSKPVPYDELKKKITSGELSVTEKYKK